MQLKTSDNPAVTELKNRIGECKSRLLDILREWHYLQNELQPKLIFVYESHFGPLENELRIKTRIASELDRRVELLSVKLNNGEELTERTIKFIDNVVSKEASRQIERSFRKLHKRRNGLPPCRVNDKYEIPQLYRKLVKKLHPDVIEEIKYEDRDIWFQIQNAYKNEDAERLRFYVCSLLDSEDTGIRDIHSERIKLKTEIRELEHNIQKAENRIAILKEKEPFNLKEKLNDNFWIRGKKRYLKEKIFFLDRQIIYKERMLRSITNGQYIAEKTESGSVKLVKKSYSPVFTV